MASWCYEGMGRCQYAAPAYCSTLPWITAVRQLVYSSTPVSVLGYARGRTTIRIGHSVVI